METSSCQSVTQSSGSWGKTVRVELKSHPWNMKWMRVVLYNLCGTADFSREVSSQIFYWNISIAIEKIDVCNVSSIEKWQFEFDWRKMPVVYILFWPICLISHNVSSIHFFSYLKHAFYSEWPIIGSLVSLIFEDVNYRHISSVYCDLLWLAMMWTEIKSYTTIFHNSHHFVHTKRYFCIVYRIFNNPFPSGFDGWVFTTGVCCNTK